MNFIAASGDTAPRADAARTRESLKARVISAVLLAPLALTIVYFGFPYYDLLIGAAVIVMAWEWRALCADGQFDLHGYLFAIIVASAVALASFGSFGTAVLLVFAGAASLCVMVAIKSGRLSMWTAAGVLVIGACGIALIELRAAEEGRWIAFWFLGTVWATDIAAFLVGRSVGGPKLAPSISPGKTWSGLVGGVLAAAFWGFVWALWTDVAQPGTLAILGMGTAVLAQLGDLGVSVVKRRFGAKDASRLIPGHGGLLDRVDGLIGAAPFVALSIALAKGDMSLWT